MTTPMRSDTAAPPRAAQDRLLSLLLPEEPEAPAPIEPEVSAPPVEPEAPAPESETEPPPDDTATEVDEAEAPAATPSTAPSLVKIVVDGQELDVPFEELKAGYSRTADYTRKTQKLADERRALEAEQASIREARERYLQRLEKAEQFLAAQQGAEPDWDRLRNELTDTEFARAVAEFQVAERKRSTVRAEREREEAEHRREMERERAKFLADQRDRLLTAIPEWRDNAKAEAESRALVEYGRKLGFSEAELADVGDHRAIVLLRKAKLYDDMMSKPKLVPPKAPPATARPGVSAPQPKKPAWQEARQRLRQSGSPRDAEAAFLAAILGGEDL